MSSIPDVEFKIKFSSEQKAKLDQVLRMLHDLNPELDKLEACGVECQGYREAVKQFSERLEAWKSNFFRKK